MESDRNRVFVVIPAYNESAIISRVIDEIRSSGHTNIIVVDDGSTDQTFGNIDRFPGVIPLRHRINRGKGAATKTGIEAAKMLGAEIIVTMDADGQHDPSDIPKLTAPILAGKADVVLGSRLKDPSGMPWYKILHNRIGNLVTWYIFGLYVTDSQSGMRAYSRHAADTINTVGNRYEYESEVLREIFIHKIKHLEVPIKVRYTNYSMTKQHKQSFVNGIKTLYKMLWKFIGQL